MSLKSKTVTATTTASGVFGCDLTVSQGIVIGVFASGYRCAPIVGDYGTHHAWNAMVIRTDSAPDMKTAANVTISATVYYLTML